VPIQKLQRKL